MLSWLLSELAKITAGSVKDADQPIFRLLSSQRSNTELAIATNRHVSSSASAGSVLATWLTIARCCASRSSMRVLQFCQSIKDRDRAMVVSRLQISLATSPRRTLGASQFQSQPSLHGCIGSAALRPATRQGAAAPRLSKFLHSAFSSKSPWSQSAKRRFRH